MDAAGLCDDLQATRPLALRLARWACLPVRVSPAFLRLARLRLLPDAGTGDEADLWLSDLVEARSAAGFSLRRGVRELLRERIAADPAALALLWQRVHLEHAAALAPRARLEEELTWRLLRDPADAQIEAIWAAVVVELSEGTNAEGVARWLVRAVHDLPPGTLDHASGRRAWHGAHLLLGDASVLGEQAQQFLETGELAFATRRLRRRQVWIGATTRSLVASALQEFEYANQVAFPATRPLWLQVESAGGIDLSPPLVLSFDEAPLLHEPREPFGSEVVFRLIDGSRHRLRIGQEASRTHIPRGRTHLGDDRIEVTIRHADLEFAAHPVLVGHYDGDRIVSAEAVIDRLLDNALSRRHALGRYPGPSGTHAMFLPATGRVGSDGLKGAVVVGLGQVGDLTAGRLQASTRDAMLDYAQALADAAPPDAPCQSAALSCLLVGTGGAGLTVRDSLESLLRAALEANRRLEAAGMDGRVLIDAIEIVELFEDVAISAGHALRSALQTGDLNQLLRWSVGTVLSEPHEGGRKSRHFDPDRSWDQRIEILEQDGILRFSFAGQRARAEQHLATGQVTLADRLIAQAVGSFADAGDLGKTLFEMLLPMEFKAAVQDLSGLVLLLDRRTARFPWEMLQDRASLKGEPLAIEAGIVRQFKTDDYRRQSVQAAGRSILIVGDPDLEGWPILQQLPGARAEAVEVRKVFESHWGAESVRTLLGQRVDTITAALHEQPWKMLHLAGHGEHEFRVTPRAPPQSGMVVGRETFLGPGDVAQMRHVPELVFINCCHLGRTDGAVPAYSKLAASLGAEFIAMGVSAVIAAGWAVDDQAATTFARAFYVGLLAGATFRHAVREARRRAWQAHPGINTWGAYQCYGDPAWRLVPEPSRATVG